jgi:hypothetical protein
MLDASQESEEEKLTPCPKNLQKETPNTKQTKRRLPPSRKKVQWGSVEVQNFHKGHSTLRSNTHQSPHQAHFMNTPFGQPPPFTPASQPPFFASPYPNQPNMQTNPLFNQIHGINGLNTSHSQFQGFTPQFRQTQNPFYPNPQQQKQLQCSREFPFGNCHKMSTQLPKQIHPVKS